jgi:predicted Zn-dependent protease
MKSLKKIDAAFSSAAALLVQPSNELPVKLILYFLAVSLAIWIPYSLVRHVYTSGWYLVSVEREAKVGDEAAARLEQDLKLRPADDPASRYVSEIGTRLTRTNNPWNAKFAFSVVEDRNMINAFAIPGGKIYITTGLLDRLDNEAELAAVLGHEVSHVTSRHYARNIGRRMLMSWVKKFLGSTDQAIMHTGAFLTTNVTLLKMRQEDELEADYQGTLYMYELEYDPAGEVTLIRKLLSFEKQTPDLFRLMALTHPPSRERLEAAVNLQSSLPAKKGLILGRERYQQNIKDILFPPDAPTTFPPPGP